MTKEEAIATLAIYKQYELKKLKQKDPEGGYGMIELVFIGPKSAATFREFYKIFLKDRSPKLIDLFGGSDMAVYFLVDSANDPDTVCISLDLFQQIYELS